jgi:hypothetical protein
MRRAWQLMELTSRSFSAMIITLDADVAQVVSSVIPMVERTILCIRYRL